MKRKAIILTAVLLLVPVWISAVGQEEGEEKAEKTKLNPGTFTGLAFRCIGPALMSGRISDIAVDPTDQSVWYVAVGSGNVWKTENAGTTWTPVFDNYGSYSIGCIAVDSNSPNIVWLGTGENVGGRHVGYGDGVYKSLDAGKTWTNVGLKNSEHIAKILVDPRDSNVVYVAVQGPLWSPGGERGLYKTTDGGAEWVNILAKGDYTGVTDIAMDPRNPDVLYAAAHQRHRTVWALINGGPESGIHKTTDGGGSWKQLNKGLPKEDMGRIGLAVSPFDPDVVYATIELAGREGGFWRSADGGESWEKRSDYLSGGTGPHYYQEIFAGPHAFDRVYQMDVMMRVTEDGGRTFRPVGEKWKHVDNHALAFDPKDPNYLLAGCDGGLYESWDLGKEWKFVANLPVTQFYKLSLDNDLPFYNIIGGTQDNNTQHGPSRTLNVQGILNSDWLITVGGDGYDCAIDPEDPNIIYSEWQNGGIMRYDRRNGELIDIQPQPEKGEESLRWNWDAPILISPHSHTRLYYGSRILFRSDDRGDSWTPISPDLSRGLDRFKMKMMGRVWSIDAVWDLSAMSNYCNITSLSESPLVEGLIYAGTDDGLIQVTEDGGQNWRKIDKFPGVPEFSFVNDIKASLHDADTVFAVFDNHKTGDFKPYILQSADRGRTWTSIVGDLPERHIVWRLVQDHVKPDLLFTATEFGIFFTSDGGKKWVQLKGGVPTISFRDLEIQQRESDLVGASFGRGFYVLDDYSPLRTVSEELLNQEAVLFPVKKALAYIPSSPLGEDEKASQGGGFYAAPNPPFGAVFTYYLKDMIKTRKQARQDDEKKIKKEGGDTPYPGWETLKLEDREEDPAIILIVTDEAGNVVRRVTGPVSAGFHRVAWDLRFPAYIPTRIGQGERQWGPPPSGPMVTPGTYSVSLAKRVDGVVTPLGEPQTFEVESLGMASMPVQDKEEVLAFQKKTGELQRAVLGANAAAQEALERLVYIKKAIDDTPGADSALADRARDIEKRLMDAQEALIGDRTKDRRDEPTPPSILRRVSGIVRGHWSSTYGPTKTHRRTYEIAAEEFEEVLGKLRALIEVDLKQLETDMEAAGAPWTPGRAIPDWKRQP
jgi:photosystem II stability/assembly factor-like uncharacterized protein